MEYRRLGQSGLRLSELSLGSWVTYGLGTENENLPAFITICPTLAHGGVNNWGAAFLPAYCQGTPIGNASIPSDKAMVRHIHNTSTSSAVQRKQLDFLAKVNREQLALTGPDLALEGRINSFELAYRMQSTMPEAQDVNSESEATKKLYGMDQPVTRASGMALAKTRTASPRNRENRKIVEVRRLVPTPKRCSSRA